MRFTSALSSLVFVVPALAAPTRAPITKRAGPVKLNSFIVTFDSVTSKNAFMENQPTFTNSGSTVVYNYGIIPATAMTLLGNDLNVIQKVLGVKSIEPDSIMSINYDIGLDGFDPVGFKRLSEISVSQTRKRDGENSKGEGIDVYGIDTGIYTEHNCFGGRAKWGATFGGYANADGNGHGTHTAGTAVGEQFGKATKANVFAVKVLSDEGSGSNSDVMSGVEYACQQSKSSGRPSVVTMSLGGFGLKDSALNQAIEKCISTIGVHFTVAAGNSNLDASTTSPANVDIANTVGAINSTNTKAAFSNWGSFLDIWALGVDVTSAWIGSPDATNTISGTSMATPQIASILAIELGKYGNKAPSDLTQEMIKHAAQDVEFVKVKDLLAEENSTKARAVLW